MGTVSRAKVAQRIAWPKAPNPVAGWIAAAQPDCKAARGRWQSKVERGFAEPTIPSKARRALWYERVIERPHGTVPALVLSGHSP